MKHFNNDKNHYRIKVKSLAIFTILLKKTLNFSFKFLTIFVKPAEYILAFLTCFILLYALSLKFNLPQHAITYWVNQNISQENAFKIGTISGLFPFSFHIDTIEVQLSNQQNIFLKKLDMSINWRTLKIKSCIKDINIGEKKSDKGNVLKKEEEINNFVKKTEQIYEILRKYSSKIFLFKHINFLSVESIHDIKNNHIYSLSIQSSKKNNFICFYGKSFGCPLTLKVQNIQNQNLNCSFDYFINLQQKKHSLKTTGKIRINHQNAMIQGKVLESSVSFLNKSEVFFEIRHLDIPIFVKNLILKQKNASYKTQKIAQGYIAIPQKNHVLLGDISIFNHKMAEINLYKEAPLFNITKETLYKNILKENKGSNIGRCSINASGEDILFDLSYADFISPQNSDYFLCSGCFKKNFLKIDKLQGCFRNRKIFSQNICYDFSQKLLNPLTLNIDSYVFKSSVFSWDPKNKSPNEWTLLSLPLYSDNHHLSYGKFEIKGKFVADLKNPQGIIHFSLSPQKENNQKAFVQKLNIVMNGTAIISKDCLELQSLQIGSDRLSHINIFLEMKSISQKFSDLITGIRQLFKKDPLNSHDFRHLILLKGKIKGNFSLSPLSIFLNTGDQLSGNISTQLDISGTLFDPKITGHFSLSHGYYENVNNGIVLKNITLEARGHENGLEIKTIRLTDGTSISFQPQKTPLYPILSPPKGYAGGNGSLTFFSQDDYRLFDPQLKINLHCNTLQVAYGKLVKARISGDLNLLGPLTGKSEKPVITGNITVDAMIINVTTTEPIISNRGEWKVLEQGKTIFEKIKPKVECNSKANKELFGLYIILKAEHDVIVKDEELECFLKGNMIVKGPLTNPYLVGTMIMNSTYSNYYNLFGKIMTMQSGIVCYDEKNINDPYLEVVLRTTINGKDIFATLSGRLSHSCISLRSNPPLSNEAILALLLFRQGLDELSINQNLRIKAFSSQMLQGNPLGFVDKLRNKFKLDSLEVVETQDISNGETIQSVRVGKTIKKAKVYIDQNLSSKNNSKMTVRYDLTPEIGIEANLSTIRESSGVGIQWMKRY